MRVNSVLVSVHTFKRRMKEKLKPLASLGTSDARLAAARIEEILSLLEKDNLLCVGGAKKRGAIGMFRRFQRDEVPKGAPKRAARKRST